MNVYFIKAMDGSGATKIGRSKDVIGRLSTIQSSNHAELKLVGVIECSSDEEAATIESEIHEKVSESRIRGEWFTDINPKEFGAKSNSTGAKTSKQFSRLPHKNSLMIDMMFDNFSPRHNSVYIGPTEKKRFLESVWMKNQAFNNYIGELISSGFIKRIGRSEFKISKDKVDAAK